jgi:hypothetical protein
MKKTLINGANSDLMPNADSFIPDYIEKNLKDIGTKGGQKYSDFIDKIVDAIFKR